MEKRKVEHGIIPTVYSTYNHLGCYGMIFAQNPSIYNWQLNELIQLRCTRRFLKGEFSSPELMIDRGFYKSCPYIEKYEIPYKLFGKHVHASIRNIISQGYGVMFEGCDDYYIEGKTWYRTRHFAHDGLICGYDMDKKTYLIYAFDKEWKLSLFEIPVLSLGRAAKGGMALGNMPKLFPIKAKPEKVNFDPKRVYEGLKEYLDSDLEKYPPNGEGMIYGSASQDYLITYLEMLSDGRINYDRADRRVFRLLMEHKTCMLERIEMTEKELKLDNSASTAYKEVVSLSSQMHIMYAMFISKKREDTPKRLIKLLRDMMEKEKTVLSVLLEKMKGTNVL